MKNNTNKTAIILAGSEGIGLACAEALSRKKFNTIIFSRNKKKATLAKAYLETKGLSLDSFTGDLSSVKDLKNLFSYVNKKYGGCDVLINNNSGPSPGSLLDLDMDSWTETFNSHFLPIVSSIKEVVPNMKKNNWGRIITIASIAVKEPIENLDLSNFFRSGIASINKTLSRELAKYNINCHLVCPGSILTNRSKLLIKNRAEKLNISFQDSKKITEDRIPLGRIGDPEDVGNLVAFLASEESKYMTGNVIQIDGGMTNGIF